MTQIRLVITLLSLFHVAQASGSDLSEIKAPCQSGQQIRVSGSLAEDLLDEERSALKDLESRAPIYTFALGLGLKRKGTLVETRALGEYVMAQSLLRQGFDELSTRAFEAVLQVQPHPKKMRIQAAAGRCLVEIFKSRRSFTLQARTVLALDRPIEAGSDFSRTRSEIAFIAFLQGQRGKEVTKLLHGGFADLARALQVAGDGHYSDALSLFGKVLFNQGRISTDVSPLLTEKSPLVDPLRLQYARAAFGAGMHDLAVEQYRLVSKSSNDLNQALSELSWAYLKAGKKKEAIGTAVGLQSGALKRTFSPEAWMVLAMSFHELCQFPEAVGAIKKFRDHYEPLFQWIQKNQGLPQGHYYQMASQFIRNPKNSETPPEIGGEWIRSAQFIENQKRINSLFDTIAETKNLPTQGRSVSGELTAAILKAAQEVDTRLKESEIAGAELSGKTVNLLRSLRFDLLQYYRVRQSAPLLGKMGTLTAQLATSAQKSIRQSIEGHLTASIERMHGQLAEIQENLELLEVELYEGAARDLVWQNANPEYQKIARALDGAVIPGNEDRAPAQKRTATWNWGKIEIQKGEEVEVWEDELGGFAADVVDNCSNKEKYAKLKFRENS